MIIGIHTQEAAREKREELRNQRRTKLKTTTYNMSSRMEQVLEKQEQRRDDIINETTTRQNSIARKRNGKYMYEGLCIDIYMCMGMYSHVCIR